MAAELTAREILAAHEIHGTRGAGQALGVSLSAPNGRVKALGLVLHALVR